MSVGFWGAEFRYGVVAPRIKMVAVQPIQGGLNTIMGMFVRINLAAPSVQ